MRGATGVIVQPHQILRLPRKMFLMHDWSLPHMKRHLQCAEQQVSLSNLTKYCACHEKWFSWLMLFTYETSFTMRGATGVIVQPHQILCLPRKMILMIDPCHIWKVIIGHLQCAEQQVSLSNLTKYDACHEKWPSKIWEKFDENRWNVIYNARPIRDRSAWSDHDPSMKPSVRNPRRNRGYFSRASRACCMEKHNISRSGYHSEFHRILRLPRKVTIQISPNTAPATKSDSSTSNAVPATKSDTSTSPNCCACHEKRHFNFTKYCACHEK